ncbi:hypothetical protein [Actinokineospora globicatena]|uniref:RNA polymerase sigma factor, sigma-70 family n=1 Tax=Actinokineospora globicatena TaxID=103729 RepID=A0A9W6VDE9_9PSEU|nr:hypothetical protein [Actinokineospora globicatena]GLW94923.1 hypothetical protein Aglo03_57390 [Actinokineospora globicatena]
MIDDLLGALHAGDAEARRVLFLRSRGALRPYFRSKLPNTDDVDDCVSEVVTRALEGIQRGARPDDLGAWVGGIARNVLKERYAAATKARALVSGDVLADLPQAPVLDLDRVPDNPGELEHLLGKRQLSATVDDAIAVLPDGLARVMREHVRLSRAAHQLVVGTELAAALEMPVADLNRQLGRARERTEETIVAVVLARGSRDRCPGLAAIVGEQPALDSVRARAVTKHANGCQVCGKRASEVDAYSKWALGPGLIGLAEDDEERRRALVALFGRAGASAEAVPLGAVPLSAVPLGVVDRVRVAVTARVASMPRAVTELAVQNPDAFRRVVAAVVAGVVLVAAAIVASVVGGDQRTEAAPGGPPGSSAPVAPPGSSVGAEPVVAPVSSSASPVPESFGAKTSSVGPSVSEPRVSGSSVSGTLAGGVVPAVVTPSPSETSVVSAPITSPPVVPRSSRWGYVLVNEQSTVYSDPRVEQPVTTESAWGGWVDAGVRKPTLVHDGPGLYRLRLPELASARGVAQVSVNFRTVYAGANARSCGVVDSHPELADQFITVSCHDLAGTPKDAPFGVLFVEPAVGGAPMAAVRHSGQSAVDTWDSTGGRPSVAHVGVGRYEVSLAPAFSGRGYLQVTPYGGGPVRCQNEEVRAGLLSVACWTTGGRPVDSGWHLTYVERGPLTHSDTPGAYAQMTPGLTVDPDRSFNSANGYMTAERVSTGLYRVGIRGVGKRGDILLATAIGSAPGHCLGQYLVSYQRAGDTWATVACVDADGKPVDRRFGVAVIRPPGPLVGERGPVVPGPAAPKWGYARVTAHDTPLGVETTLDGQWAWTTWSRGIPLLDALWVRKPTVVHQGLGRYRVRLPGIGSSGLAHVTPFPGPDDVCSIVDNRSDGVDELIDVACFGPSGLAKDQWFTVFFGERVSPSAVMVRSTAPEVVRVDTGRYEIPVSTIGNGHPQLSTVGPIPARCRVSSLTPNRIRVDCATPTGAPTDTPWHLTYVEGVGLHQDPTTPAAYATVDNNTLVHTYTNGAPPTLTRRSPGRYTLTYPDLGPRPVYPADIVQITMFGPHPHHCAIPAWNSYGSAPQVTIQISCNTPTGTPTDAPFSLTYLRRAP